MGGFTREELVQRAGVLVHYVDRLVELGIGSPGEGDSPSLAGTLGRRTSFMDSSMVQYPWRRWVRPFEAAPFPSRSSTPRTGTASED